MATAAPSSPPLSKALAMASRVVAQVTDGASLTVALASAFRSEGDVSASLRGAVQDLAYATLRDYGFVDRIADSLATRPPQPEIRALIMVSITSLRTGRRADHAIVDQAVDAATPLGGERAKGFVNAVLRRFLRERGALERAAEMTEPGRYRHPQWWIDRVRGAYAHDWESILAVSNTHPAMTLRVNRRRATREDYLARLAAHDIEARAVGEDGVLLAKPMPVDALPGFRAGEVSVQDAGAQLAATLLGAEAGMQVLDACAAPGGKTAHLLERADVALTAVDSDAARATRIRENLDRLGLAANVIVGDATRPQAWAGDARYHRILLDAPCTASGVVRRHPDIKWLRRADDVDRFAATQAALLDALWQRLLPGGRMLYATCSVFPEENVVQVERFLSRHPDAHRVGIAHLVSGQLLPAHDHDGFFYALLEMRPAAA